MLKEEKLKKIIENAVSHGFGKNTIYENIDIGRIENDGFWTIDIDGFITFLELFFNNLFTKSFAKYLFKSDKYLLLKNQDFSGNQKGIEYQIEKQFKIELALSINRFEYVSKFI